jgi:hypothetical protein
MPANASTSHALTTEEEGAAFRAAAELALANLPVRVVQQWCRRSYTSSATTLLPAAHDLHYCFGLAHC